MKKIIVATVALMAMATVSTAGTVITTGGKSGSYIKVGHNLAASIPGSKVVTSKGSVENLDRLMLPDDAAEKAHLATIQMDAYAWYLSKHPEAKNKLEIMGPLYEECVYIAVNSNGDVQSEDDLQSKDKNGEARTIAVGKKGAGTAVTWDYMRQLETGYQASAVSFKGGIRALGKLAAEPNGALDAVMWVTKPGTTGKMLETVLKNENLSFLKVNDSNLNNKYKPTGKPIYRFKTIDLAKGFMNDTEIKTICVDAAIVADTDYDEEVLETVSDLILNYKETLLK